MKLSNEDINLYKENGVIYLKNAITNQWIKKLLTGIKKISKTLVNISVLTKEKITKNYFMMIIAIGKEYMSIKIFY